MGTKYSQSYVDSFLSQQGIRVESMHLDTSAAERWAERLHERYPSDDAWEQAKRSTLGGELRKEFVHEPGRMPMTTDWWVALQVEDTAEDRIIVDDAGGEWRGLREMGRAMTSIAGLEWLTSFGAHNS